MADVEDYAATSASGCTPQLGNYAPLTWTCTQTPQQDTSKNDYFMAVRLKNAFLCMIYQDIDD